MVPLGPAARIDPLVAAWREQAGAKPPAVRTAERTAEGRSRAAGEQLRRIGWDPVVKHLAGAKRTFVVPDGSLHFVNVAALPTSAGHYLVETGPLIHYLSTERDLVRDAPSGLGASTLIAFGGADFDRAPTGTEEVVRLAQAAVPALIAPASTSVYRGPRDRRWN